MPGLPLLDRTFLNASRMFPRETTASIRSRAKAAGRGVEGFVSVPLDGSVQASPSHSHSKASCMDFCRITKLRLLVAPCVFHVQPFPAPLVLWPRLTSDRPSRRVAALVARLGKANPLQADVQTSRDKHSFFRPVAAGFTQGRSWESRVSLPHASSPIALCLTIRFLFVSA